MSKREPEVLIWNGKLRVSEEPMMQPGDLALVLPRSDGEDSGLIGKMVIIAEEMDEQWETYRIITPFGTKTTIWRARLKKVT